MGDMYFAPVEGGPWTKVGGISDFSFVPDDLEEFGSDEPILTEWPSFSMEMTFPPGSWEVFTQALALSRIRDSSISLWNEAKREQWNTWRGQGRL